MKLRNPWIDPRVAQVQPAAARAYLLQRRWNRLQTDDPAFEDFAGPTGGENAPVVRVPLRDQGRDYPQRVIELITDLALAEGRLAVAVLDDILAQTGSAPHNGPPPSVPAACPPAETPPSR
jgi:hypothetical protein